MASFRGGNMACRSRIVDPGKNKEIDYTDLLIAQKGIADKFNLALDQVRLVEAINLDENRKIVSQK